jgi:myo-inositol-hexaphosphate 3-phosphohydrolase
VTSISRLFADHSLTYRKIKPEADALALQDDLDRLQEWERKWMMSFNPSKCEVVHITKKRSLIVYAYKVHQSTLQSAKSGKYLGVNIANNLSWNTESTIKKANNSLSFLKKHHKLPTRHQGQGLQDPC